MKLTPHNPTHKRKDVLLDLANYSLDLNSANCLQKITVFLQSVFLQTHCHLKNICAMKCKCKCNVNIVYSLK